MPDALLDRIAAAKDLPELDSVRVSLLGKQGEITAKLKSLGSMEPTTRAAEAPKIHALREQVTERDRRPQGGARRRRAAAQACDREGRPVASRARKRLRAPSTRSAR